MKEKTHDIEITKNEETTLYTVGPLAFGATMRNPALRKLMGLETKSQVTVEETDLPDEDQPEVEEKLDMVDAMPAVICATVRKIDGVKTKLTPEELEDWDVAVAVALFQGIFDVLGLKDGGQLAATFRCLENGVPEVGESLSSVREDAE